MQGVCRVAQWRLLLLAVLVPAACVSANDLDEAPPRTVLRGVTVIDGTGAPPVPGRDVLIQEGRIVAVVPTGSGPEAKGDRVLDLPGRYVMPGLVDTHAHVTILEFHREADGATRAEYRRDLSEQVLRLLLAHGVTTVRNPSAPVAEGVALRDDVERGEAVGPRIVTSGPHLNDPSMSSAEIRAEVRGQAAAGVDFIKVYAALDASQVGAAIDEAHALGLPVVGHLQGTAWTEAARLGIDGITHGASWNRELLPEARRAEYRPTMLSRIDWMDWLDLESEEFVTMLRELAGRRIPVDPTLITYHTKFFGDDPRWTDHPELRLVPELAAWWGAGDSWVADWTAEDHARARGLWPKVEEMIRRYHEGGVLLAAGSDLPQPWTIPGISLHEEMELLARAGIPSLDVLTIATRNGAEALGLLDEIGTVEPDKRADLLILAADPSLDIRNTRTIELVIQDGRMIESLDLMPPGSTWREGRNLLVHVPHGLDDQLHPAVLYLHGGSQRGTDLERLRSYGPVRMLAEGWQPPFILIAPQLPEGAGWDDAAGLVRLIDELASRYPINPERVAVVGLSLGGRGAWKLAHEFPDRLSAIATVAAYQPRVEWTSNPRMRRLAVRAYHGDLDELAPYAVALAMHEALRAAGGNSELVTLLGRDHFVADVLHDPALYDWLLAQRRAGSTGVPQ